MGDSAVDIFLETLKQIITSSELGLVIEEKHQLQSLEEEIKYLRGFLKVTEKKRNDHPKVMKLVMQIRDLIFKAENVVELFVVHTFKFDHGAEHKDHPLFYFFKVMGRRILMFIKENNKQHYRNLSLDLKSIKKGTKTLTAKVKKIYDKNMYNINGVIGKQLQRSSTRSRSGGDSGSLRGSHTSKVVKENEVVGLDEEVKRIIDKLDDRGEGRPLEIVSIIGTGGGGKTTLAREVYDNPFTSYTFEIRAWIDVSQAYDRTRKRDLLINILESAGKHEDYKKSSDDKLGEEAHKCLKDRKYLIVMDDIWDSAAWNDIQRSFPKEYKGSKVLFTSRLLVQLDSVGYVPHYLSPLPKNCCWELLNKKVFGMKCGCPPELVGIGKKIAEKCEGLPLAVITIAGILATEDKTLQVWENVAQHVTSIIAKNWEDCMEILELSYNHLPLHLKACFLYIGGYPGDKEIHVRELIWLWIAEGFIQKSEGGESLETIAKDYLRSLIDRSLVQVARKSPLGGIKTCRVHDLLRELCLKKAEDDNFFVTVYRDDSFSPSVTNKHRRLLIGRQFLEKISLWPRNLRSFLCLSRESEVDVNMSFFVKKSKLLRVLSFMSARFHGEIGIEHLVHLRYLAYTFTNELPFSYLRNLETLNLYAPIISHRRNVRLPWDTSKMVKLRHLYTKHEPFAFHIPGEETGTIGFDPYSTLDSLQTLHHICACMGCRSFLMRTPNLRKLGLYGAEIIDDNVLRFPDLEFLECLETLTFTLDSKSHIHVETTLPPGLKLPLTITRITFQHTRLKWEELSLLQTLPSLEVLRLLRKACHGPIWNMSELEGFPQLKYLRFNELNIEEWNASEDQFSKLEVLVLEDCRSLKRIPIDFANLNELREVKLVGCRTSVLESAREIQEEQINRNGDDDCLNLLVTWSLLY